MIKDALILGVHIRNEVLFYDARRFESLLFNAGVRIPFTEKRQLKLTYSIDLTLSKLRSASFGSHELSLVMDWNDRYLMEKNFKKRSKKRQYQCPKDFGGL